MFGTLEMSSVVDQEFLRTWKVKKANDEKAGHSLSLSLLLEEWKERKGSMIIIMGRRIRGKNMGVEVAAKKCHKLL